MKSMHSLVVAALLLPLLLGGCAKTLRVAPHAELKVFDPIWTTAYITRNHGYLVYDTLFGLDENFEPQPQMVSTWTVSDDRKVWTFTLRDGLKWHDNTDVTAEDCVASLKRWGKRDGVGQQLFNNIQSLSADDAKTFTMKLRVADGLVLESLAKMSSNVPFMMPKRLAETDPFEPIQDPIGSGPFMFKKDEWIPGQQVVYVKNPNYLPRQEESSLAAGGKIAGVDRIVWKFYPDQSVAVQAMIDGKLDYIESVSTRLVPTLQAKRNIVVASTDPLGNMAMARFNTSLPPFDNAAVRRAVIMAMRQEDYMSAALGDPQFWRTCYSVFPCGTLYSTDAGSDLLKTGDVDAAKRALQAAGYDGTPVIILNPVDVPVLTAFAKVTADKLRQMGMTVEVEDMDWATLTKRRANRGADGKWSMFHTWWIAADVMDPMAIAYSGDPQQGWFGWLADAELEKLRAEFAQPGTLEHKKAIAEKVQQRLMDDGAVAILGQFFEPVAYRSNVTGITSPIQFYWNMSVE